MHLISKNLLRVFHKYDSVSIKTFFVFGSELIEKNEKRKNKNTQRHKEEKMVKMT